MAPHESQPILESAPNGPGFFRKLKIVGASALTAAGAWLGIGASESDAVPSEAPAVFEMSAPQGSGDGCPAGTDPVDFDRNGDGDYDDEFDFSCEVDESENPPSSTNPPNPTNPPTTKKPKPTNPPPTDPPTTKKPATPTNPPTTRQQPTVPSTTATEVVATTVTTTTTDLEPTTTRVVEEDDMNTQVFGGKKGLIILRWPKELGDGTTMIEAGGGSSEQMGVVGAVSVEDDSSPKDGGSGKGDVVTFGVVALLAGGIAAEEISRKQSLTRRVYRNLRAPSTPRSRGSRPVVHP